MPITIQELLASDTLSQAVDKINFNFDQLLLNGGGPVGPAGIPGPTGPAGGRGLKGATWYTGGADPNTLIIPGIEDGDYFLQSNGDVWEYNGTVWIFSTINLQGPTGSTGSSVGFDYIGGYNGPNPPTSLNNENVAFPVPMPAGISGGANQLTNQGVSTVLLGGVGSTVNPPAGITYTSAFQIPDTMAVQLDASLLSVLVHQKDSSSSAIRFMGGGDVLAEKYEQSLLSNLSNISLGIDDTLNFNVPKAATSPVGLSDLIGLNINTIRRGQQLYAGKQINLISGADSVPSGLAGEISDITLTINTSNPSSPAKLSVATTFASATTLFEIGGNILVNPTTSRNGIALIEAGSINLTGSSEIRFRHNGGNGISLLSNAVNISGVSGPVNIQTNSGQNINLNSNGASLVELTSTTILLATPTLNQVATTINLYGGGTDHWLKVDNSSLTLGGTKIKGNVTWNSGTGFPNPAVTTHRNISIYKFNTSSSQSPVYINEQALAPARSLMLEAFKGLTQSAGIEYLRLYTASTDIYNTSGNAGFVGHTVENTSANMPAADVGFRLRGRDRTNGVPVVTTRFHASEDTTAVHNRLQYVRKTINIDPLLAGLSGVVGYTIPASAMDASYIDIRIGGDLRSIGTANVSTNSWRLYIPEGTYVGQRLIVHVIAIGCTAEASLPSPAIVVWPSSSTGAVEVYAKMGAPGASTTDVRIGRLSLTAAVPAVSRRGAEALFELLWVGTTYDNWDTSSLGNINRQRTSGWILTNGTAITDAVVGDYDAVESNQQWT